MNYVTLERFEDNGWAVLERADGETFNVPREWIPEQAREGDVLSVERDLEGKASRLLLAIDPEETERRRDEAQTWYDATPKVGEGDLEL